MIKKGLEQPKCKREWEQVSKYFKTNIHHNNEINKINQCDETEKNPSENNYHAFKKKKKKKKKKTS